MSIISNRHQVSRFIAGKSVPLSGQRLMKIGYKKTKDNPNPLPSVCLSVPFIADPIPTEQLDGLMPYIRNLVMDTQDKIARSLYESSEGQLTGINDDEISVQAVINYLSAERNSNRLTKELITDWFNTNMKDNLTVVFAEKLNNAYETPEEIRLIDCKVNAYKGLIVGLSNPNVHMKEDQIKGLIRAFEVSSVDDDMSEKLVGKLNDMMKEEKELVEMLAL